MRSNNTPYNANGENDVPEPVDLSLLPPEPATEALAGETDLFGIPVQKDLFGNVAERPEKRRK